MQDTLVTLQGWLGSDVTLRRAGDAPVANFRLASTPRRFNRKTDEWVDSPTQWYTVNAWRSLAENAARSLRRADPVVIHGRLNTTVYTNKEGVAVTAFEIEATFIGHDLSHGTTSFHKTPRFSVEERVQDQPVDPAAAVPADATAPGLEEAAA